GSTPTTTRCTCCPRPARRGGGTRPGAWPLAWSRRPPGSGPLVPGGRRALLAAAGADRRGENLAGRLDQQRHPVGDQLGVAVGGSQDAEARPVADRLDDHQPALHLDERLTWQARLEDPGRPVHQAGEPGRDGRELLGEERGDVVRQGQGHAVGGDDSGVRHVGDAGGEVTDKPVQVLAVCVAQLNVPSPARGGWPPPVFPSDARRVPRWNPARRLRACSGDRRGTAAAAFGDPRALPAGRLLPGVLAGSPAVLPAARVAGPAPAAPPPSAAADAAPARGTRTGSPEAVCAAGDGSVWAASARNGSPRAAAGLVLLVQSDEKPSAPPPATGAAASCPPRNQPDAVRPSSAGLPAWAPVAWPRTGPRWAPAAAWPPVVRATDSLAVAWVRVAAGCADQLFVPAPSPLVRSRTLSGSQTRADSPWGAAGRSRTLTRCRSASRATANRPMCRETDTSIVGGLSSRQFMSRSRSSETPMPRSMTSMSTPPLVSSCMRTWTWVSLGEKIVAFSISSARRCTTSDTAWPMTETPGDMFSAT